MKKIRIFLTSAVLMLSLLIMPLNVRAEGADLVVDDGDLLTEEEESSLESYLNTLSDRYNLDVAVVTVYGLGGRSIQNFADDYFWFNGYGRGAERDGILLVIDMQSRQYYECTSGYGITAFTDYGLSSYLEPLFLSELSHGQYYDAFMNYGRGCEFLLEEAANGQPYDIWIPDPYTPGTDRPEFKNSFEEFMYYYGDRLAIWGVISLVIGLIAGSIHVGRLKSELTSVTGQSSANDYFSKGSFALNEQTDEFLYRNTARTRIETETRDYSGGGGGHYGGSSTHISSSSGHSFGGHGGKF